MIIHGPVMVHTAIHVSIASKCMGLIVIGVLLLTLMLMLIVISVICSGIGSSIAPRSGMRRRGGESLRRWGVVPIVAVVVCSRGRPLWVTILVIRISRGGIYYGVRVAVVWTTVS